MANGTLNVALKKDWLLANPWLWLGIGLALILAAWGWARAGTDEYDTRVIVLAFGLLAVGAGSFMRWSDRETTYLQPWSPQFALVARFVMGCTFLVMGLGLICFLGYAALHGDRPGFYPGATFLVCLTVAPVSLAAARRCLIRKDQQGNVNAEEEASIAFLVAAGACVLGWFALWNGTRDWDTIRLFLRALAGVCAVGAALVTATSRMRRLTFSTAFVLHFTAIASACLSIDPAPWLIKQAWMRLFRPYLESMYVGNAYHFYAPDPGPASYLWFRVIFTTPEGRDQGLWYKVPDVDEDGNIRHPVSLEYQRFLAMTESVAGDMPLPAASCSFDTQRQRWVGAPELATRMNLALAFEMKDHLKKDKEQVVGEAVVKANHLRIPVHRQMAWAQQVRFPNEISISLLASNARFVAAKFAVHPQNPAWEFKSVKVYRVPHYIPPIEYFSAKIPPTDPDLYRPYYSGTFNRNGDMIERDDPYYGWMLPSIREHWDDPASEIRDYCRLHAGDSHWIRPRGKTQWAAQPE